MLSRAVAAIFGAGIALAATVPAKAIYAHVKVRSSVCGERGDGVPVGRLVS